MVMTNDLDGNSLYGDGGCAKQDKLLLSSNGSLAYSTTNTLEETARGILQEGTATGFVHCYRLGHGSFSRMDPDSGYNCSSILLSAFRSSNMSM